MKGHETMFSFAVFAVAAFFCAGAYYLHTGLIGALLAMLGIGICAAALFHRALQQYFSARAEMQQVRDEKEQQQLQRICDLLRQSQETQESGRVCVAEELTAMRAGVEALAESGKESLAQMNDVVTLSRDMCGAFHEGNRQVNSLLAEVLPNLFSALEERMAAHRQELTAKLGEISEHQLGSVQQLEILTEVLRDILNVCDFNGKKADAANRHLAQMAEAQIKQDELLRKLEDIYQRLKKIHSETKRSGDAAEDLQKPLEALGAPLSDTLGRVMQEIKAQHKAQQTAMEQYKSMTTKDVQILEQLARAVK